MNDITKEKIRIGLMGNKNGLGNKGNTKNGHQNIENIWWKKGKNNNYHEI